MSNSDVSYRDVIEHVINMRLADLDGTKDENVEQEDRIRLYDEFNGMIRLASVICDVPYPQVFEDAVRAVYRRMFNDKVMQAGEDEEVVGLT